MQLINLNPENTQRPVSARELYDALGYDNKNWSRWHSKNIEENPFAIPQIDWEGFFTKKNGNVTMDFALSIDFAKRLAMMAKTEKGEQVRQYFLECERQLAQPKELSRKEMALMILASEEEKERMALELYRANHKIELLSHTKKTYTSTEIAKEANLKSAYQLNILLHQKGIQFKQGDTWVMYAKYADKGYTELKQQVLDNGTVIYHRLFTQSGREFILNILSNQNAA